MNHIGIDLGSRTSSICVIGGDGMVRQQLVKDTQELERWFATIETSWISLESCAESRLVAIAAIAAGHEVRVVPTKFVRSLGVGQRGIKTDKRDALNLARASSRMAETLPSIHIKGDAAVEARMLLKSRAQLISIRTRLINFVRSKMREALEPPMKCTTKCFAERLRSEHPKFVARPAIAAQLAVLDTIQSQLGELDEAIKVLASSEAPERLQKIPGVGPVIAVAFIAALDDPHRFTSAAAVASYFGLSPGENTTGGKIRRTGIVASGESMTRALLLQGAHSMMNTRRTREPLACWAEELQLRKGRKLAVVALARRMVVVMWAMLRDGTRYNPVLNKPRPRHVKPKVAPEKVFKDLSGAV